MIDARLEEVRRTLANAGDVERKVELWKHLYHELLEHTLHGLHEIAFREGIGGATRDAWLTSASVAETPVPPIDGDRKPVPVVGVQAVSFYKGHQINVSVDGRDGRWRFNADVMSSDGKQLSVFDGTDFQTRTVAWHAAVESSRSLVDSLVATDDEGRD